MTTTTHRTGATSARIPLSGTQQWWCADDLGDDVGAFSPQFTSQVAVRVAGQVDTSALQAALDDLVERHEILRTIVTRDAEPRYQTVHPPSAATLVVRDVEPSERERDVVVQEIITREGRQEVDLRRLPLLRAGLNRFDEDDSVLVLTSHHTMADGWSMHVLMRDLAVLYKHRCTGVLDHLPEPAQYQDFVSWEQARIAGPEAVRTLTYWREKLAGGRIFSLPSSRPVSGPYSRPYSALFFSVDPDVTSEVLRVSRASVFMVLLAAFNVLAHEIDGTDDPVVNTFSSGRHDPRTRDIVGSIVNTLPLRTTLAGSPTFREVVTRTRRTCLEAFDHEVPTSYIDQEAPRLWDGTEDPWRCNFFAFNMPQSHVDDTDLDFADGATEVRKGAVEKESESMDLADGVVWAMDLLDTGELTGTLRFNVEEFDEDVVSGWVASYQRILTAGVQDPERDWTTL